MNRPHTNTRSFSRDQLHAAFGDVGGSAMPAYLPDIVAEAGQIQQRPAWTFLGRWVPVDIPDRPHGVPRVPAVFVSVFLLVTLLAAGIAYVGSQLMQPEPPLRELGIVEPSPSLLPQDPLQPASTTFTSEMHGISIDHPAGWQTRPATEPWRGERLDFDSPAADVIFDPTLGDGLYLIVASRTFSQVSADEWTREVLTWTCPEAGGEMWGWEVDGVYSFQRGPCNSGSLIATATRGYLIRLVASSDKPGDADHWDWLKPVLATVDLRPEVAVDPAGAGRPVPLCADIPAGATYTNRFGIPKLSATVPIGAPSSWQGNRDDFEIGLGDCRHGDPIRIDASIVDAVIDNACDPWTRDPVAFGTLAEAAEAIVAQPGHRTSEPTAVTIAGQAALRLEVSTEGSTCSDGIGLWYANEFALDRNAIVHLVDMDGDVLAITVWYIRSETTPVQLTEAHAIVDSIRIER